MPLVGFKHSEESKRKIGEASKKLWENPEYRQKATSKRGRTLSQETRNKIRDAQIGKPGKPWSEETRAKLKESRKGRINSPETRKKISESKKNLSAETRKKLSEGRLGKKHTPESKQKMSDSLKGKGIGRVHSEETRRKISEGNAGKVRSAECIKHYKEIQSSPEHVKAKSQRMTQFFKNPENRKMISNIKISLNLTGEKCPAWKGGVSFEPYCHKFNDEFKNRVRAFFGYKCVECGAAQNGKTLSVHHVNFDKMSCCNDVEPLFVPLCAGCHPKTNHNRPYWEQHFTDIINTKYNGKCYLTKQEVI